MSAMPHIFEYTDYQTYLGDYYKFHKDQSSEFSHRVMARSMGFTSPNFLKLVIDRERHLSKDSLQKVLQGLNFKKKEGEYFSYLVYFARAKTNVEKNYFYSLISAIRAGTRIALIQSSQFEYFSKWYISVVRELISGKPADSLDFNLLAKAITPPVLPKQIKKSVEILLNLGLIRKDKDGRFLQSSPVINTRNQVSSLAIRNYHDSMIEIARQSLDSVPSHKREISACTLKISQKGFENIKHRIQAFREELLQMAQDDEDVDRIYQLNMQFFPLVNEGDF